ncbi:uncharacterized protein LOC129723389 isoform X1 [Wyeomyia smithii]|uniref:uncharacterized protein LOC129723389 isoform X1 n=1 Tax=Wyeomyia smithii TaxID=174621 RepID=UPI002467F085|nr:uncharacterized protein LOC129723389 isoform X1 [Wyeomyia smithii]
MSRKNNKRITWNESHVYKILQYVQQIYRPDKEPYILVSELHGLLRGDSSLAAYSKNQLKMKLYQIKQAIDRYSNGSTGAGLITRRVYFDLALAIYGKKPRKSASCEERIEGEQTQLQSSDHHQFEQIKRFITVVENRFQFPKIGCCRLCRSTYTTGGVDLFQDTYDNQSYNQLLQNMLFITIDEKIDASRKICARCAKFLENVAAFVQQCHISNGILSISESSEAFSSIASADNPGLTGKNDLSGNKHYFPEYTDSKCEKNENAELSAIEQIDIDYLDHAATDEPKIESFQVVSDTMSDDCSEQRKKWENKLTGLTSNLNKKGLNKSKQIIDQKCSWKASHLRILMKKIQHYQQSNKNVNHTELVAMLKSVPELAHYSSSELKSKLYSMEKIIQSPQVESESASSDDMDDDYSYDSQDTFVLDYQEDLVVHEIEMLSESECFSSDSHS